MMTASKILRGGAPDASYAEGERGFIVLGGNIKGLWIVSVLYLWDASVTRGDHEKEGIINPTLSLDN
jgi:hypothetical protein